MLAFAYPVHVVHDYLDYLAAFGGAAGGVAGIVALVLASRSKRDAGRSADAAERSAIAAEQSMTILRQEADTARVERARQAEPDVYLEARALGIQPNGGGVTFAILSARFLNRGSRQAELVGVRILVPRPLSIEACGDENGNAARPRTLIDEPDVQLGQVIGASSWRDDIGPLHVGGDDVRFFRIPAQGAGVGEHVIEIRLLHADLPGGQRSRRWSLAFVAAPHYVALHELV